MEMLSIIISLGISMKTTLCCRDIVVNRTESDQNSQNLRYASTYLESLWSSVEQPNAASVNARSDCTVSLYGSIAYSLENRLCLCHRQGPRRSMLILCCTMRGSDQVLSLYRHCHQPDQHQVWLTPR